MTKGNVTAVYFISCSNAEIKITKAKIFYVKVPLNGNLNFLCNLFVFCVAALNLHILFKLSIWRHFMLSRQILKLKLDINIKTMFTYFLFAKDALAGSKTYILSQNQKPDPSCQVELSRGARAWLAVVAFHILFLVLNLYVFAKLAEETELSMFARKRRLWIDFVKPRTVSETKMFYFFKAPAPEKEDARPLPQSGKLFLIVFSIVHFLFFLFNLYYFMPKSE